MTRPRLSDSQPPRDKWEVEIVEQKTESGLVLFEYAVRETAKDPFLLNNHKAQIRTDHQRIVVGPNGGIMHVSGVEVLDLESFEKDKEFYRWKDRDRSGNWRDDQGRTLAPFLFPAASWAGGQDEELDPQWQRETFTLSEAEQIQECIDRYQERMVEKGYVGDKRGTTLNLQVGASAGDAVEDMDNTDFSSGATTLRMDSDTSTLGNRRTSGWQFTGVTIAGGSTINSAILSLYIASGLTAADADGYAEDVDSAANFSTTADVVDRTLTTAVTAWTETLVASTSVGTMRPSPDFDTLVQEVTDRGGWSSGNALMILLRGTNRSTGSFGCRAYDLVTSTAGKLDIDYTAGGGGGTVIPVFMKQYRQRWN